MLTQNLSFFESKWKRILIIALVYAPFYGLMMLLTFRQGPESMARVYGPPEMYLFMALHSIVEVTVIYYLLIFRIALPLLQTKSVRPFLARLGMLYLAVFVYEGLLNFLVGSPAVRAGMTLPDFVIWHIFIDVMMLCISFAVALLIEWNVKSKRQEELEKQKMDAELSAIKYQINPHFLFNSLSFIYSKTIPLDQDVAHAVMLLSDIMRYALGREEDNHGRVDLARELTHLKNVIEMNQMRYNNRLNIAYLEKLENTGTRIPPLVLITLVENAFKHGDLSDPASPLVIEMSTNISRLQFSTRNKKRNGPKELSNGIGLTNVRQRLALTYGARHSFEVSEDEQFYATNLIINL